MIISFKSDKNHKIKIGFAFKSGDDFILTAPLKTLIADNEAGLKLLGFDGSASQTISLTIGDAIVIATGLGDKETLSAEVFEKAVASAIKAASAIGLNGAQIHLNGAAELEGFATNAGLAALLASYKFDTYKTKPAKSGLEEVSIDIETAEEAFADAKALYEGVAFGRDLMNEPPNKLTTEEFAKRLVELKELGVEVTVLGEKELAEIGAGSFLGVGQGSPHESRLVVMKYNGGGDEAPLALVGKGLVFDAGGISLKPAGGMEEMKGDMGGAAAVSGTMKAIAGRKAKANVVGLVGLAENMPDGNAQRPGDIVTSLSGKTIEVLNTDAEGRLVLCDVLTYAQNTFKPKYIIDLATLTGAIIISLGHDYAGLFSNSDDLSAKLTIAGDISGEKLWRLPLGASYDKLLDSKIADIKNVNRSGPGSPAGSITAAQFLQRFIDEGTEWAHLDIAGTAWKNGNEDPREPSWATGFGVRLLDTLVRESFEK